MAPVTDKVVIQLKFPITVKNSFGNDEEKTTLVLHRPKTKHARKLAAIAGPELVKVLMNGVGDGINEQGIVIALADALLHEDKLKAVNELLADLAHENESVIDNIDWLDLPEVLKGLAGFFPALNFTARLNLPQT